MPTPKKSPVAVACDQSIDKLRKAQKKATPLQWRRMQHAISRLALTAGYINPVGRETKKEKQAKKDKAAAKRAKAKARAEAKAE